MRVLLVDDHTLFREGLALLLASLDPPPEVLHAATLQQALQRLAEAPQLVLLDLALPGSSGIDALHRMRAQAEDLPLVVISGNDSPLTMRDCIDAGAMGFIPKTSDSATMRAALAQVLSGQVYLPPGAEAAAPAAAAPGAGVRLLGLTPRQLDVLQCLVQGKTNKAIARELGINDSTVKSHVTAVLHALQVSNRTEAVYAVRNLSLR